MLFPIRKRDSHKNSTRRLDGNGPKPKTAATEAYNSGHSWTLPAELLDSRLHCHACPRLADTQGRCQGRELSSVRNSLCPPLWAPGPGSRAETSNRQVKAVCLCRWLREIPGNKNLAFGACCTWGEPSLPKSCLQERMSQTSKNCPRDARHLQTLPPPPNPNKEVTAVLSETYTF